MVKIYEEPLVDRTAVPDRLAGFTLPDLAGAEAAVRNRAGWHIAPVVEEVRVLDGDGGRVLALPTLRLVELVEVVDMTDPDAPRVLDGYRVNPETGVAYRSAGWPRGVASIQVKLRHGFEKCPPDLVTVLRESLLLAGANRAIKSESLASRSVTFDYAAALPDSSPALAAYCLGGMP